MRSAQAPPLPATSRTPSVSLCPCLAPSSRPRPPPPLPGGCRQPRGRGSSVPGPAASPPAALPQDEPRHHLPPGAELSLPPDRPALSWTGPAIPGSSPGPSRAPALTGDPADDPEVDAALGQAEAGGHQRGVAGLQQRSPPLPPCPPQRRRPPPCRHSAPCFRPERLARRTRPDRKPHVEVRAARGARCSRPAPGHGAAARARHAPPVRAAPVLGRAVPAGGRRDPRVAWGALPVSPAAGARAAPR